MLLVGVQILDRGFQFAAYVFYGAFVTIDVDRYAQKGTADGIGRMAGFVGFGQADIDVWTDD